MEGSAERSRDTRDTTPLHDIGRIRELKCLIREKWVPLGDDTGGPRWRHSCPFRSGSAGIEAMLRGRGDGGGGEGDQWV